MNMEGVSMKINKWSLFWGILLIGFGVRALAQTMGYANVDDPVTWAIVFGGISLLSLVFYFLDGIKSWGWLFPAGIFGALSFLLVMAANDIDTPAMVAPLFLGIGLPFVVAFFIDRANNWWALIPAGVMLFLALLMLIVDNVRDDWIGALFLFALALSFFIVYLINRTRTWALLVGYILFALSLGPALTAMNSDAEEYFGAFVLFAIAFPFFVVYFRSADHWWAIIPAGVLTTLDIITSLAIGGLIRDMEDGGYSTAILMGGLAVTFAVVWIRHAMNWAKIVTIVLASLTVVSVFFTSLTEIVVPVAIILVGAYLLFTAMRPKTA
jgi:hypothetical protein